MTPDTQEGREARARAQQQEAAAVLLAEKRGQESAELRGQLASHEQRLNAVNGSIERSAKAQEALAGRVGDLAAAFDKNVAITTDRAQAAKEYAERQVSTRQFFLGLIGAVTALGMLLAATGHA